MTDTGDGPGGAKAGRILISKMKPMDDWIRSNIGGRRNEHSKAPISGAFSSEFPSQFIKKVSDFAVSVRGSALKQAGFMLDGYDDHERIVYMHDAETGLEGFIAIHSTHAGPAVGGTRLWHYADHRAALNDALKLSRAMSYKCALSGVPFGGGKAVLMARKDGVHSEAYWAAYARFVNELNGLFRTGEDVGMKEEYIEMLAKHSRYIIGAEAGHSPSPFAAESVYTAMHGALRAVFGSAEVKGKTVTIKGMGKVGYALAQRLHADGASLIVADIDPARTKQAQEEMPGIVVVDPSEARAMACDVYAPCALGGDITAENLHEIKAKIVCGAANNQLESDAVAPLLMQRGIVYVPDFISNAGGLIDVVDELNPNGYSLDRVHATIQKVEQTTVDVLAASQSQNKDPLAVAHSIGKKIINRS